MSTSVLELEKELEFNRSSDTNFKSGYLQNFRHIKQKYNIFSEQFLEKPYVPPKAWLTLSGTICTWRGIPTIDDPDVD